jgi:hypothetical protein
MRVREARKAREVNLPVITDEAVMSFIASIEAREAILRDCGLMVGWVSPLTPTLSPPKGRGGHHGTWRTGSSGWSSTDSRRARASGGAEAASLT